jgi:hypothetical protein
MDTAMVMKPKNHVQKTAAAAEALKAVMIVNLILLHMDLNVVIVHGMNLVSTVLLLKPIIAGIVPVVTVQVMVLQYAVMAIVRVMKPMTTVQMTAYLQVNVLMVKYLIVMVQMNAGLKAGLAMVLKTVKTSSMVLI